MVDMYSISSGWDSNGTTINGKKLTTKFFGGIFSLDGLHPTMTAQALIANEFIKKINSEFKQNLKKVNVSKVFKVDPNQTVGDSAPAKAYNWVITANHLKGMLEYFKAVKQATREAELERQIR
jgi:hypothetical protein